MDKNTFASNLYNLIDTGLPVASPEVRSLNWSIVTIRPRRKFDWIFPIVVIIAIVGIILLIQHLMTPNPKELSYSEKSKAFPFPWLLNKKIKNPIIKT